MRMESTDYGAALELVATRISELSGEERLLADRLKEVREQLTAAKCKRDELAKGPRVEEIRDAVTKLRCFTVSELAAELGIPRALAKKRLEALAAAEEPIVRPDGRYAGQPMYAWIDPRQQGPGEAFEAEQRLRVVGGTDAPTERSAPVAGVGDPSRMIANKVVRGAVKEALEHGWQLEAKGDGHYRLVKQGVRVGVAGTPKNPDGAAEVIRRQVRNADQNMRAAV